MVGFCETSVVYLHVSGPVWTDKNKKKKNNGICILLTRSWCNRKIVIKVMIMVVIRNFDYKYDIMFNSSGVVCAIF